ncbi:PAS domain-containing sensor histidine kinase [Xanthomonas vesicatoria]|uniref:histidine kinase n=1 Tax=Xanthomonas vesicatoria TaxID=56460 RepID=A0AAJ0N5K4_9XANT|nr:PAS domain-containing sensor histidine kinase [Xanthomonas vesicatoria]APO96931.1 PAS domain-containing sensor histidine kinase [Xanthomonas vesicatoria]KHM96013.1 transcriptional regulator [Xanthomonas vesicatoria]KHM98046.1 transcriptional regulator [Xanthomonas vesicatoria]MCC8623906.1 PAS domain S-box protein [Xanthomonas vesicatoria]MCC8695607.1 PAS domain S-box protein [Xanthomonas vesicatoria]
METETPIDNAGPLSHDSRQCQLLVQSVSDYAIYMLDIGGYVRSWNPGGERIKGYCADEVLGSHFSRFYLPEDVQRGEPMQNLDIAKRQGRLAAEGWRLRKDGSRFWASVVIEPVLEFGVLVGFAKITRDVTDRHEAQRLLQQAQQALLHSQKVDALGRLTLGMAHDFNNLLTVMVTSLDLIALRAGDDARTRMLVEAAQTAVDRGTLLTRQLLAFARGQRLVPERHPTNAVVTRTLELLRRACPAGVALSLDFADALPDVRVDPSQLESALLNLVFNSCDAMPAGGAITLITAAQRRVAPSAPRGAVRSYVSIAVRDNGPGMSAQVAQCASEPFFTTKDVGKGSGLGLSQVFGFASQSGGFVDLQTAPGCGTTVTLFLPAIEEAEHD